MNIILDGIESNIELDRLSDNSIQELLNILDLKIGQVAIQINDEFMRHKYLLQYQLSSTDKISITQILAGG